MKPTTSVTDESELKVFLDDLENRLEEIEVERGETFWKKYIREPSGDLDEIERRRSKIILNEQYLSLVTEWKPKCMHACIVPENETPQWASQSIFTTHPIYFQNYVLADLIAAQTIAHVKDTYGKLLNNAEVSKFLIRNYYAPGASVDWPEKIRKATGRKLSAGPLVQELTNLTDE